MIVKEMMQTKVYFVKDETKVTKVVNLMKSFEIGMVPVCDNIGTILGVITDRDVLLRTTDFDNTVASEIMTKDVATVNSSEDIHQAALIFSKRKVRRLPVTENGKLVGILSISDLARKRVFLAEVGEIVGAINK